MTSSAYQRDVCRTSSSLFCLLPCRCDGLSILCRSSHYVLACGVFLSPSSTICLFSSNVSHDIHVAFLDIFLEPRPVRVFLQGNYVPAFICFQRGSLVSHVPSASDGLFRTLPTYPLGPVTSSPCSGHIYEALCRK